jgi:hypothetical protein
VDLLVTFIADQKVFMLAKHVTKDCSHSRFVTCHKIFGQFSTIQFDHMILAKMFAHQLLIAWLENFKDLEKVVLALFRNP